MFAIVRRKSRSELVRQELGQGVEHFRQAANHAARGTGATVGPKLYAARDRVQPAAVRVKDVASTGWGGAVAALAPLAAAASENARQAGKQARKASAKADQASKQAKETTKAAKKVQRKAGKAASAKKSKGRSSKLTGLLVAGAVAGAAAAYLAKRRQTQQWDEYDPSRPIGTSEPGTGSTFEPTSPTAGTDSTVVFTDVPPAGDPPATGSLAGIDDPVDQTSSALHNPEVARLTGGNPNKI